MEWRGRVERAEPGGFNNETSSDFYMLPVPSRGHNTNLPITTYSVVAYARKDVPTEKQMGSPSFHENVLERGSATSGRVLVGCERPQDGGML